MKRSLGIRRKREIETWQMKDIEEEEFHDQLRSNDLGNSKQIIRRKEESIEQQNRKKKEDYLHMSMIN